MSSVVKLEESALVKHACRLREAHQKSAFPTLEQHIYHLGLATTLQVKVRANDSLAKVLINCEVHQKLTLCTLGQQIYHLALSTIFGVKVRANICVVKILVNSKLQTISQGL